MLKEIKEAYSRNREFLWGTLIHTGLICLALILTYNSYKEIATYLYGKYYLSRPVKAEIKDIFPWVITLFVVSYVLCSIRRGKGKGLLLTVRQYGVIFLFLAVILNLVFFSKGHHVVIVLNTTLFCLATFLLAWCGKKKNMLTPPVPAFLITLNLESKFDSLFLKLVNSPPLYNNLWPNYVDFKKRALCEDLFILFFLNSFFFNKVLFLDPFAYSTSELLSNFFPLYQHIGSALRSWQLPLWDPYYYFSFLGVSFSGVFYPPNLVVGFIGSFLDMDSAFRIMQLSEILHYLLASMSMYLLLRTLCVRREGALLGAITFAYSGFLAKSIQQTVIINTVSWFPLVFLYYIKGLQGNKKAAMISGLFLGIALLAGYMAITFYICAVLLFYCLWISFLSAKNNRVFGLMGKARLLMDAHLLPALVTFLIAVGIGGIQLVPTLEYAMQSVRHGAEYDSLTLWGSIPPAHLISLIVPHFFGGAHEDHWGAVLVAPVGFWEVVYYPSLITLSFACLSLITKTERGLQRQVHSFAIFLFLLSVFMMMGKNSATFGLYHSLKVLPASRIPARWGFLLDFSVAVAGGIGFSYFIDAVRGGHCKLIGEIIRCLRERLKFVLALGILLAMVFIGANETAGIRNVIHFTTIAALTIFLLSKATSPANQNANWWIYLFVILAFVDVFDASSRINPAAPYVQPITRPTEAFVENKFVQFFKKDNEIYRVSGLDWPLMQGQANKIFTLGYLGGFSYKRFAEFRGDKDPMGSGAHSWFDLRKDASSQWIDFYNVKYLFSHQELNEFSTKYVPVKDIPNLYLNKDVMPRAFVVKEYEVVKGDEEILKRMAEIDLSKKVVLEETPVQDYNSPLNTQGVEIKRYAPLQIDLEVGVNSNAILVMSDVFYPGWKVYIDGIEKKILRANYVFRAVEIQKGQRSVTFRFEPSHFRKLLTLFFVTLFVVCTFCLWVKANEAKV